MSLKSRINPELDSQGRSIDQRTEDVLKGSRVKPETQGRKRLRNALVAGTMAVTGGVAVVHDALSDDDIKTPIEVESGETVKSSGDAEAETQSTATTIVDVEHGDTLWSLSEQELRQSGVDFDDPDYYNKLIKIYDQAVRDNSSAIREGDVVTLLDEPDTGVAIVDTVPRHSDQAPPPTNEPPATLPPQD